MAQGQIKFGVGFNVDKSGLNTLKASLKEIQKLTTADIKIGGNAEKTLKEIQGMASQVEGALERAFNPNLGTINLTKFNNELKGMGLNVGQMGAKFAEAGAKGDAAFRNLTTQLLTTKVQVKQTHELLDKMANTLANTVRWTIASSAVNALTGSIQKAYNYTVDLDTSLNDIRIVTEKSADEMDRFAVKANNAAKVLGASTKAYSDASLIYFQQGLNDAEVEKRTQVTLKAANVTGQSAAAVSEQLTAVWNGYKITAENTESAIDKLAAVAASTAADLEELSTGMSRVASAANIMGVDIDQLNAQLATIVSVTREAPESIGTALKTIYARMSDLEAGTDAETTLGEYTKQMAQFGFQALDAQGNLRDMGDVIEEIGDRWGSLSRNQQVALAQTVAGTRQYARLMSLFDNWEMYEESLQTSINSAGTLQKQQDIYMESTEAHLQKLSTQAEELYAHLFDAESVNDVADALTKLVELVDGFVQSVGGGAGVLQMLGTIGLNVFGTQISKGIATSVKNIKGFFEESKQLSAQQAIINDLGRSDTQNPQVQKLIELKQRQLDLTDILTDEEAAYFDEQLKGLNEIFKQQDRLIQQKEALIEKTKASVDEEKAAQEVLKKSFVDAGAAKTTLASLTETSENKKVAQTAQSSLASYERKKDTRKNLKDQIVASEAVLADENASEAAKNRAQATLERTTNALAQLDKQFEKAAKQLETTGFSIDKLYEEIISAQQAFDRDSEEWAQLELARKEISQNIGAVATEGGNTTYDVVRADPETKAGNLEHALAARKLYNQVIEQSKEKLDELSASEERVVEIENKTKETVEKTDDQIKKLGETSESVVEDINNSFNSFNIDTIIDQVVDVTGKVVNLATAFTMLSNLDDIWGNDNLTTGEKFAQTLTNIGMALPMLIQGFTILNPLLAIHKAHKAAVLAVDQAQVTLNTIQSIQSRQRLSDSQKEAALNVLNSISEEKLAKETRETLAAKIQKGQALNKNERELLKEAAANQINAASEDLSQKKGVLKTTLDKGKDLIGGFKKGGKGLVEGFKGARAAKAAGSGVKAAASAGSAAAGTGGVAGVLGKVGAGLAAIGPVGWIAAAAIAAVTAATILTINARNKEKKALAEAQKAQERATESLAKAQSAFSAIKSTLDGYKDLKTTFSELTKNTTEWKKALQETNAKALELLKEYPELSKYATRTVDGLISISDEGMDALQDAQYAEYTKAQNASIAASQIARDAQIAYDKEMFLRQSATMDFGSFMQGWVNMSHLGVSDLFSAITGNDEGEDVGFFTQIARGENPFKDNVTTDQLNTILKEVDLATINSGEELQEVLQKLDKPLKLEDKQLYEALIENKDELIRMQEQIAENNRLMAIENAQMYSTLITQKGFTEQEAAVLGGMIAAGATAEEYNAQIEADAAEIRKKKGSNKDLIKAWAAATGLDIDEDSIKGVGGGKFKYSIDGEEKELTYDQLAKELAIARYNNNAASTTNIKKQQELLSEIGSSASSEANNIIRDVFASNTAVAADAIEDYSMSTIADLEAVLTNQADALSDIQEKALQETINNMRDALVNMGEDRGWSSKVDANIQDKVATLLSGAEASWDTVITTASKTLLEKTGDALQMFMNSGGETAMNSAFTYLSSLGIDSANKLMDSIDWTSKTLQDDLVTTLSDLGHEIDYADQATFDFMWETARLNNTFLSTKETFKEVSSIVSGLSKKGDIISGDDFATLLNQYGTAMENYFSQMADGTYVLTTTAAEFAAEITRLESISVKKQLSAAIEEYQDYASKREELQTASIATEKRINEDLKKSRLEELNNTNSILDVGGTTMTVGTLQKGSGYNQAEAIAILKRYLQTGTGAELLDEIFNRYGVTSLSEIDDSTWRDIVEKSGGNTLTVDRGAGKGKNRVSIDYSDMATAIIDDEKSKVGVEEEYYTKGGVLQYINTALTNGFITEQKADELKQLADIDAYLKVGASDGIVTQIQEIIKNSATSGSTENIKSFAHSYLALATSDQDLQTRIKELESDEGLDVDTILKSEEWEKIKSEALDAVEKAATERTLSHYESQAEAISKINSEYEHMNSLLDRQRNLIKLTMGEDAYEEMAESYAKSISVVEDQLENNKKSMDYWAQEMEKALAGGDAELYEEAKANWEEASGAYYENMSQKIELLKEQEINAINAVFKARESLGTKSLDYMTEDWELSKTKSDMWLDPVNAAYGIDQVRSKFNKALNNTSDINAQRQIRNLMEEQLEALESQDKLSEYDLKRAEAKLTLLEKEIALRDAQNNKTKMQLMRGADGSYSYQYVADASAMVEAEEELAAAQNELYNIDLDEYKSNLDNVLQYYQKFKDEWLEVAAIANDEERAMRQQLLKDQYFGEDGILTLLMGKDNDQAFANLTESAGGMLSIGQDLQAWINGFDASKLETELEGITSAFEKTEDFNDSLTNTLALTEQIAKTMAEATWGDNATLKLTTFENGSQDWDSEAISSAIVDGLKGIALKQDENGNWFWDIASAATGAYTGEWGSEGRFIQVHEKELILNKEDTVNILNAVDMVRSMKAQLEDSMLRKVLSFEQRLGSSMAAYELAKDLKIEQNVHISAEFPNVSEKSEIEEAFEELINLATQHAFDTRK